MDDNDTTRRIMRPLLRLALRHPGACYSLISGLLMVQPLAVAMLRGEVVA